MTGGGFPTRYRAIVNFEVALECLELADCPGYEDAMMWGEYGFAPRFRQPSRYQLASLSRASSGYGRRVTARLRVEGSASELALLPFVQDLPKRFHFGSKQFDRHLRKVICRISKKTALSLH